jgi:hypothetical protein
MRRTGELSGEGVVLVGPFGDEGPQGSVGGEDAVVTVAVDAGWREDLGESVQELESRETEGGAAGEVGPWEQVEDLVGAAADQVEAVEGKRRPGTVANEALQSGPVGGLDADACIQTEPAAVIPGEHILGLVGFQEAVTAEVPQDPFTDGMLEALQELKGEGCGFVEAEAGVRVGRARIRVILRPLEEPVDDAQVGMEMRVQGRAEAMEEAHGTGGGAEWSGGTGLPQGGPEGSEQDMEDGRGGTGSVVEEGSQAFGHGEDELADGYVGNDVVYQVSRGLGHALGVTGRTYPAALAGERHQEVVVTRGAASPCETMGQDPTPQVASELFLYEIRNAVAHGIGLVGQGEVGLQVLPDDAVEGGGLRAPPPVGLGVGAAGPGTGGRNGPAGPSCGAGTLDAHGGPGRSRGTSCCVSISRRHQRRGGRGVGGDGKGERGQTTWRAWGGSRAPWSRR